MYVVLEPFVCVCVYIWTKQSFMGFQRLGRLKGFALIAFNWAFSPYIKFVLIFDQLKPLRYEMAF